MGQLVSGMQEKIRSTAYLTFLFVLKLITGLVLGLTLALGGRVLFEYEQIGFFLVILTTAVLTLRLTKSFSLVHLLILDLILILVGMVLKLYIHMGPGL